MGVYFTGHPRYSPRTPQSSIDLIVNRKLAMSNRVLQVRLKLGLTIFTQLFENWTKEETCENDVHIISRMEPNISNGHSLNIDQLLTTKC